MLSAALLCIVFRTINSCKLYSLSAAISNGHRWGVTSRFPPEISSDETQMLLSSYAVKLSSYAYTHTLCPV